MVGPATHKAIEEESLLVFPFVRPEEQLSVLWKDSESFQSGNNS